ncbi:MAG: protein translocase subunit SecDF [Flavobacteriales bacterium]|tara:strand:+ start:14165 stop:17158 length:2994 start_codon:yes stop_codon:yes gene_type:complete
MQNKGLITAFAIALGLASLYQLSFSWVANGVEGDAESFSAGDAKVKSAYLDSMMSQEVYPFLGYTYAEVKKNEMNLGLDLKGGMNVILEVSVKDVLKGQVANVQDPLFQQTLANTDAAQSEGQNNYLNTFFAEFDALVEETGGGRMLSDASLFGTPEMTEKVGFNASNEAIQAEIRRDVEAAIANVFTVLRARIDQFGTTQPNIQRLEGTGRILVELPGVKDPARVKKLLQSTAELQFWNMYEGSEVLPFLVAANEKLRDIVEAEKPATEEVSALDLSDLNIEGDADSALVEEEVADSTDIMNTNNPLFEVFRPWVSENGMALEGPRVGYALIRDTAEVNALLARPEIAQLMNTELRGAKFLWNNKPEPESDIIMLLAIKGNRDNAPELDGGVIVDARPDLDEYNRNIVTMAMNGSGAQKWQRLTAEAAAQTPKRSVAVVLDNYVYSYPQVQNEIAGGRTQITGNFSQEEASDLANILRAGKLDAPARIIQADVVGPSLGKEAISDSVNSFAIALLLVLIYMYFYYSGAGLVANLALFVNMFFIFGLLASFRAVLTLPGMAGIVLTIGMAVDANVIIFERIREELRLGKGLRAAIVDGYKNSNSAIIDANVTTLIVGIILFAFGTGPIRGFATTLIIGILTSLFSALFISRLVFERRLDNKKEITFSTKMTANWYTNINFDFLRKRKVAYGMSTVIVAIGLFSLFTKGLNLGVDFVGGRSFQVRFDQPVEVSDVAASLGQQFIDADGNSFTPVVKTLGDANQVIITTNYRIGETGTAVDEDIESKLYAGVNGYFVEGIAPEDFFTDDTEEAIGLVGSRVVGPTIADDIKTGAVYSIIFSLIVVFLYILVRFRKWQFSLGAVVALVHDVLFVMGIFSLLDGVLPFQLEVDQAFIAAILTVIGYSLNDTVVVFDRIRENMGSRKANFLDGVNKSLNQTLSRTFNTSVTTFFVLLVIFLFGGEVIRGFMFALLLGVLVGTYSSLFIATPVMFDATKKDNE